MNKIIELFWYRGLGLIYHWCRRFIKYKYYKLLEPGILLRVKNKKVKRVVFFVVNIGMWKSNELFQYMLEDEEFDPYIVSYLYTKDSYEYRKKLQEGMKSYFTKKDFPFIECFDFKTNKWFDIKAFEPDIIFYAQPYNHGYKGLLLENVWRNTLFGYIPYCLSLENNESFHNQLYLNICWRIYTVNEISKEYESKFLFNKGENIVVSGNTFFDEFDGCNEDFRNIWKQKDESIMRIIWAPHHSILKDDALDYGTFLDIADDMLKLKDKYKGLVQFAFKPHPILKPKLYGLPEWGVNKTDDYYERWAESDNSIISDGEYGALFKTSNAMIHDCSSFTAEYLYTEKPVMFITKNNHGEQLNELGKLCYRQHYIGRSIKDIDTFIKDVLAQKDPMKNSRKVFKEKYFCGRVESSSSKQIYLDIKASI